MRACILVIVLLLAGAHAALGAPQDDPDTEVAKRLFAEGSAAYDAGRYQDALRAFEKARLARPSAAFDYNIARCHDRLGRWEEALDSYRRFVAGTPDPVDAAEADRRIRVLSARLEAMRRGGEPPGIGVAPAPSPPPPPTTAPSTPAPPRAAAPPVAPPPAGASPRERGAPPPEPAPAAATSGADPSSLSAAPQGPPGDSSPDRPRPVYRRWWFWTAAGAVILGGAAVGLGVGLSRGVSAPDCIDCGDGIWRF